MLSQHIEGRVLDLVQRVVNGARVEDSRVECKAVWPEARRTARQLAGHANMARGEPILWIIGVDEDGHQVTGASDVELADWWAQVVAALDQGIAPGLTPLVVPVSADRSVVALYMTTERAPYIVKRQSEQGPFEREVPWRDGNRTRSAHRHELLRLLVAATSPPDVTVVRLELRALHREPEPEAPADEQPALPERIELDLRGTVFFGPPGSTVVVLPQHLMTGQVDFSPDKSGGGSLQPVPITIRFHQRTIYPAGGSAVTTPLAVPIEPHPFGVDVRLGDVYVTGPGALVVRGYTSLPMELRVGILAAQQVVIHFVLPLAGGDHPATFSARLERSDEPSYLARWVDV
jgi:hypothetical protein